MPNPLTITPEEVIAACGWNSRSEIDMDTAHSAALCLSDPAIQQLVVRRRVEAHVNIAGYVRFGGQLFLPREVLVALLPEVPDHA